MELYQRPDLGARDHEVLAQIQALRTELAAYLRVPTRWQGALRRTSRAKAIRGSNSIEGINATLGTAVRTGVVLVMAWIIVFLRTAGADHGPWDAESDREKARAQA